MSSEISLNGQMKTVMEDKRDISPPLAIDDEKIKEWLQKLDKWSSLICKEYSITCKDCGTKGHFT
jgi:hypothetical protein